MLSLHQAQLPATLPRDRRTWILGSARSPRVLSCSKLSAAREKKPQCASGTHYPGRNLRMGHSASPSYRSVLFQRATTPPTTTRRLSTTSAPGPCRPTILAGFLQTAFLAGLCLPIILRQFRENSRQLFRDSHPTVLMLTLQQKAWEGSGNQYVHNPEPETNDRINSCEQGCSHCGLGFPVL